MSDMVEAVLARTQVMFEDLKRDIGMIADRHLMLSEKIDGLTGRVDRVETRLVAFQDETRQHFAVLIERLERLAGHRGSSGRSGVGGPSARRSAPRRPR